MPRPFDNMQLPHEGPLASVERFPNSDVRQHGPALVPRRGCSTSALRPDPPPCALHYLGCYTLPQSSGTFGLRLGIDEWPLCSLCPVRQPPLIHSKSQRQVAALDNSVTLSRKQRRTALYRTRSALQSNAWLVQQLRYS